MKIWRLGNVSIWAASKKGNKGKENIETGGIWPY